MYKQCFTSPTKQFSNFEKGHVAWFWGEGVNSLALGRAEIKVFGREVLSRFELKREREK
jgi:hypothetical protein